MAERSGRSSERSSLIEGKGSANPLVDTKFMHNSVTYSVDDAD